MTLARVGPGITLAAVTLLVVAVAGIAPWVIGPDLECDDRGPHAFFLVAWPAAGLLGLVGAIVASAAGADLSRAARRATAALGLLVLLAAIVFFFVVVADGVRECGF